MLDVPRPCAVHMFHKVPAHFAIPSLRRGSISPPLPPPGPSPPPSPPRTTSASDPPTHSFRRPLQGCVGIGPPPRVPVALWWKERGNRVQSASHLFSTHLIKGSFPTPTCFNGSFFQLHCSRCSQPSSHPCAHPHDGPATHPQLLFPTFRSPQRATWQRSVDGPASRFTPPFPALWPQYMRSLVALCPST